MTEFFSLHNILILAAVGLMLFFGIFALRGVIKVALKILRIVLILFAIAVIVGGLFGYLDISLI
ncbi:MAG: hypothetical protein H0S79_24705 [Anaerolineaceae bacterium]|nr:hypothetical protein [Anaerolineaceae bacterium]